MLACFDPHAYQETLDLAVCSVSDEKSHDLAACSVSDEKSHDLAACSVSSMLCKSVLCAAICLHVFVARYASAALHVMLVVLHVILVQHVWLSRIKSGCQVAFENPS